MPPKNEKHEIQERCFDVCYRVVQSSELNIELSFVNYVLPSSIVTLDPFAIKPVVSDSFVFSTGFKDSQETIHPFDD